MGIVRRTALAVLLTAAPVHAKPGPFLPVYDPQIYSSKQEYLWVLKGVKFAEANQFAKAMQLFQRAVRANPESQACYWQGIAYEQKANNAIRQFYENDQPAAALDPKPIEEDYLKAIDSYDKALEFFPQDDRIHYRRGKAGLVLARSLAETGAHLLKAAELKPLEPSYHIALAEYFLSMKSFSNARKEAESLLGGPKNRMRSDAFLILGRIELAQKNFEKAIQILEQSLSSRPPQKLSHFYMAEAYSELQQEDPAAKEYRNFIKDFIPADPQELRLAQEARSALEALERKTSRKKTSAPPPRKF